MTSQENTTYNILFSDIADKEIEKAIEYHSSKSENGKYNFKTQLNQVLDTLELNPFFQFRYKKIRAVPFKTLPYLVFFEVYENENIVYVYSVFHTAQNPDKYPL
ncbi:type II toxin-antitoxin system RelE/ParE family toxin [Flavobacterium covae]|uniref:type II toxin-antitoxin system RelE/ParE family toxin n=1 Tax=Flavobacterium covae TaxID=2906076 RepID=UPI0033974E6E